MEFSKIIKNLRTQHNMSQTELAKIAGVTDGAVSSWENPDRDGKYKVPRMGVMQKIADHFNVNKSALLGIEEAHVKNIANIKLKPLDEASIRRGNKMRAAGMTEEEIDAWADMAITYMQTKKPLK